jgi:type II secretory pathway pseudopilin PulG
MVSDRTKQRGFVMAEVIVGTALLGLAIAGLAVSLQGTSMFNQYQWTRQRCVAAAEAQLDSLAMVGKSIDEAEIKRLWPEVDVAIERTAGEGPWNELDLLQVTATGATGARVVTVRLERYLAKDY